MEAILERLSDMNVKLILEPGRLLVGNAGIMGESSISRRSDEKFRDRGRL
jgi:diaminopimelate decarboxylase